MLKRFAKQHFTDGLRLRPLPVALAVLLVVLLFVPILRDHEDALFVVEPSQSFTLHATLPGHVEQVLVRESEHVQAGQPLLQLRSSAADALRSSAEAQTDAARFQAFSAEVHQQSVGTASASRSAAMRSTALANSAQSLLLLRAPVDAVVLSDDPAALLNQNVGPGQSLLTLAGTGPRVVRLFVPASELDHVPHNAQVALVLPGKFSVVHLTLPALEGDAVTLPKGLIASQDYKGISLPTFYYARIPLPASSGELPLGLSGEAKIFGPRRSLVQRGTRIVTDLLHAHLW